MSCDQVCRTRPARSILHPKFEECRALLKRGHCQRSKVGGSHLSPDHDATLFFLLVLIDRLLGNFVSGWLGAFWDSMGKTAFFLMIALVAVIAGAATWVCYQPLRTITKDV